MLTPSILIERATVLQDLQLIVSRLPPNIAGSIPPDELQAIMRQMYSDFIWPQIITRQPFEKKWDELQLMYEAKRNPSQSRQNTLPENQTVQPGATPPTALADTIIFDTVDRLKNLNLFISWKDAPVQYNRPRHIFTALEDQFYNPTTRKIKSANAILDWNLDVENAKEKHLLLAQHHYLYGISFMFSDWTMEFDTDQSSQDFLLINKIGTTFEPLSIRRVFMNPTIPIHEMEKQICPFFFDLKLRAEVLSNQYDPQLNPFGFDNLDKLSTASYLFSQETESFLKGLPEPIRQIQSNMRPEFSGEALWTFYPILNIQNTGFKRYIFQAFSNNLMAGGILPIRIQELYYPKKRLPIYGASHIPDLDSGLYTPSIASILQSHYDEIVRTKGQIVNNMDWINNPPTDVVSGSPAANSKGLINAPGRINEVFSQTDITRRVPFDTIPQAIAYIDNVRGAAQTSGKAVDAILGKAMGSRTTATEASNAFQASMSGVTADVDHFLSCHYGEFSTRAWENQARFLPKSIRDKICGNANSPPLEDQDLLLTIGVKTDMGSTFIESIVKQQHLQQAIASAVASPVLDQATLWKALFRELKLNEALDAVRDNGFEFQVALSTEQAAQTYYGLPVAISPSQDHQIAIEVKTRFLLDTGSSWNKMAANPSPMPGLTVTQYLAKQIEIHQQFVMLQKQQELALMQAQAADENSQQQEENRLQRDKMEAPGRRAPSNGKSLPQPQPQQAQ